MIERRELGAGEQRLVDDGAAGERAGVEAGQARAPPPAAPSPVAPGRARAPTRPRRSRARAGPPAPGGSPDRTRSAVGPSAPGLTGTSRQPRNGMPSLGEHRLDHPDRRRRAPRPRAAGRTRPRRRAARAADGVRAGRRRGRRGGAGIWVRRPAPSPELSVDAAPRCATRATASSAMRDHLMRCARRRRGRRSRRRRRRAPGWDRARSAARRRGVSWVVLTGTGRVDPLPIGGHGASCVVGAPSAGEAGCGAKKSPLHWERAGSIACAR